MEDSAADERVGRFINWTEENGIQFRGCTIKQCMDKGGFGVYSGDKDVKDILMVSPLALALTPMTILKDPFLGTQYREMLESDIDERLLVMIFLIIEHARGKSSFWAPYLEMLPSDFGTPLWFKDEELVELQGTTLFEATKVQLRSLRKLFDKVKGVAETAMSTVGLIRLVMWEDSEIDFKDFLWANCVFWTRALNIPCPASFASSIQASSSVESKLEGEESNSNTDTTKDAVWIEGLVPGIDFCNHAHESAALWEVDDKEGSQSGVPHSMYLVAGPGVVFPTNTEIRINYGDKGNEELLFLYGFVEENNTNDYIMVHFPKDLLEQSCCLDSKLQLLQEQDMQLRWLLPASFLEGGFLRASGKKPELLRESINRRNLGYSWSGLRKPPSYLEFLVFPEEMLSALRVLAMSELAFQNVVDLLEELSRVPSKEDIQAAVWEVCGDAQALKLLADIFSAKMAELIRGTGTEDQDEELLQQERRCRDQGPEAQGNALLPQNRRASVIYRKGQKHLVSNFLKEAELALAACLSEDQEQ